MKIRLPLSFAVSGPRSDDTVKKNVESSESRIEGETYDISMEGLTVDTMLSPRDMDFLLPLIAGVPKEPKIRVTVELEGQTVSLAGAIIWYNLFFPGTPPPNFKAGLYIIEPESNTSKQKWNEFLENTKL